MATYYDPQSIAPILAQGGQEQAKYLSQVAGAAGGLQALGGVAQAGFGAAEAQAKRRSLLEAQQGYAQYLAKVDSGTATPQDHAIGRMYGMSLGIAQRPMEAAARIKKSPQMGAGKSFPVGVINSWVKKITTKNPSTGRPYANLQDIPGGMAANSLRAQVAAALGSVQGYDVGQGVTSRAGATSEAGAAGRVRGGKGSEVAASVGTLHDVLGYARQYVRKLTPSQIPAVNAAFQKGERAIEGDPDATALLVHMNELRGLYAQILHGGGTPTDMDYKEAGRTLIEGLKPDGFDAMAEAIIKAGRSRAGRLTGKISNEDIYGGGTSTESADAKKAALRKKLGL